MNEILELKKQELERKRNKQKRWQRAVSLLCVLTMLVTSYSLILPALTLEKTYCGLEEHTHSVENGCYIENQTLICGLDETGHVHNGSCYAEQSVLSCGLAETEGHTHTDACLGEAEMICGLAEDENHSHSEGCYAAFGTYICGMEESAGHSHSADCYTTQQDLICGMEEAAEGHIHGDGCYYKTLDLTCEQEEHVHKLACYSNPEADVETAAVWERSFEDVKLTGVWADDVLAIADTQLGYTESAKNYAVMEDGETKKGYTRFGAWYGDPYGDWCAMFISFCLNYADVDRNMMPIESGCERWVDALKEKNLYHGAEYLPEHGDLVFFDNDQTESADHVGIVYEILKDAADMPVQIKTIEGNSGDRVQYKEYDLTDERILGYGELPKNPNYINVEEPTPEEEINPEDATIPEDEANAEDEIELEERETVTLTARAENGVVITMTASAESLPFSAEELTLEASVVEDEAAKELIESEASGQDGENVRRESVLFDIRLMHGGEEVEPIGPVHVSFSGIDAPKDDAQVYHVDTEADKVEEVTSEIKQDGTITAETSHFSIYGVTYTVDFKYGEYTYSILGKSEVLLSELFTCLHIERNATDVTAVVFSDSTLIRVEQLTGDWKLSSIKAFNTEETLTITFSNGETMLVDVTDAPQGGIAGDYVPGTASLTGMTLTNVISGTAPFDENNNPGNDSNANNSIVRSFDSIYYNIAYTLNLVDRYSGLFSGYEKAYLYIKSSMIMPSDQVTFDLDAMPWLQDAQLQDFGVSQVLTGRIPLTAKDVPYIVPGTGTIKLALQVKNAPNGTDIRPNFSMWLDDGANANHQPTNTERLIIPSVRVSSSASVNVSIVPLAGPSQFANIDAGNSAFTSVGIIVSAQTETIDKGRKGIYLGDVHKVSFNLYSTVYGGAGWAGTSNNGYNARIWDYSLVNGSATGVLGKTMFPGTSANTGYNGLDKLPYSSRDLGTTENSAYNSGTMTVTSTPSNGLEVTFDGIEIDYNFPTESATGKNTMYANRLILATGVLQISQSHADNYYGQVITTFLDACRDSSKVGYIRVNDVEKPDAISDYPGASSGDDRIYSQVAYYPGKHNIPSQWFQMYASGWRTTSTGSEGALYKGDVLQLTADVVGAPIDKSGAAYGAADMMIRFDGRFLEPIEESFQLGPWGRHPTSNPFSYRIFYVAFPSGQPVSGFYGVMTSVRITDWGGSLRYYNSMSELHADLGEDAVPVGIYIEIRDVDAWGVANYDPDGTCTELIEFTGKFRVRENSPAGDSYVVYEGRTYSGNTSWTAAWNGTASHPWAQTSFMLRQEPGANPRDSNVSTMVSDWVQWAGFNGDGTIYSAAAHTGNNKGWTDSTISATCLKSLFVVGEQAIIEKYVAQEKHDGEPRKVFCPDTGETAVDYVLDARALNSAFHPSSNPSGVTSNISITDTLPKELKYVPGSAYFGGTYNQPADRFTHGTVSGGNLLPDNGTINGVITSAGSETGDVSMEVTENADGTTTLKWTVSNVVLDTEIPKIHYSAELRTEYTYVDNQQIPSTAQIQSTQCKLPISEANGSESTSVLQIISLSQDTAVKKVVTPVVDKNEPITYNLSYTNNSGGNVFVEFADYLPYNGDPRGSVFHGSYVVQEITAQFSEPNQSLYNFYLATPSSESDTSDFIKTTMNLSDGGDISDDGRTFTLRVSKYEPQYSRKMFQASALLSPGVNISITITLKPEGNQGGDIYANDAAFRAYGIKNPVYLPVVNAEVRQSSSRLVIEKKIESSTAYELTGSLTFPFEVSFVKEEHGQVVERFIPEDGSYVVRRQSEYGPVQDTPVEKSPEGKLTLNLSPGYFLVVDDIPSGFKALIEEKESDAYDVNVVIDNDLGTATDSKKINVLMNRDHRVVYTNKMNFVFVQLTKKIVSTQKPTSSVFQFEVTMTAPIGEEYVYILGSYGKVFKYPSPYVRPAYVIADQYQNIVASTAGTTITIRELDHSGYTVLYKDLDDNGNEGMLLSNTDSVTFILGKTQRKMILCQNNSVSYGVALPNTGSVGTTLYTLGGAGLILSALMFGFRLRRKRERRANE